MIQSRVVATTVLILIALTIPAIAQDDLTDAQYAELSRALDMPVEEIRAMNLSPDDLQVEAAGTWGRGNVATYADLEFNDVDDRWRLGGAVRFEHFGPTINGKLSARYAFMRASVSSGFRAPTPGQQNGFNISTIFDPAVNDLINRIFTTLPVVPVEH